MSPLSHLEGSPHSSPCFTLGHGVDLHHRQLQSNLERSEIATLCNSSVKWPQQRAIACFGWGGLTPKSDTVSFDLTHVPAKWHVNRSNGLSRVPECDRQTTDDRPRYRAKSQAIEQFHLIIITRKCTTAPFNLSKFSTAWMLLVRWQPKGHLACMCISPATISSLLVDRPNLEWITVQTNMGQLHDTTFIKHVFI